MSERLSSQTAEAIATADRLLARDTALIELVAMLDPDGTRSAWAIAGDLAERLRRFQSTAWPRICNGAREPRNILETALAACCAAGCPRTQRKLYELVRELTAVVSESPV